MSQDNYTCDLRGCGQTFRLEGTGWSFTRTDYLNPEQKVRFCSVGHLEDYQLEEREYLEECERRERAARDAAIQAAAPESE